MKLALVVALVVACGPPQRVGDQPSWRKGTPTVAAPQTFAPASEPAARYNEPAPAPPKNALADAIVAAVADAAVLAKLPPPVADGRLFRACAELAEIVPEDAPVAYDAVEFALQRNGIIEPSPRVVVVWGDGDDPAAIVEQLRPGLPEMFADGATTRVGVGATKRQKDGTSAIVFALQGSGLTTKPIPRAVAANGRIAIDATVDAKYRDPEVLVTHVDGATERIAIDARGGGAFAASVACGPRNGKQQVEILAIGATGSTVLANFPIWCGAEPPLSIALTPASPADAPSDAADAERRLLALANRDRQAAGVAALVWDEQVAAVARAHSEEMKRTKIVAHVSPTTGSAADRVRAAGIKTAAVLENVARAYGVATAHDGLMNSPGHRANLLSPIATHVGIGVVLGDADGGRRDMFVTQLFIRKTPKVDPSKTAELVREKLAAVRAIALEPHLVQIAQRVADGLAAGKTRDQLWPDARKSLGALGNRYGKVGSVITAVAELDGLDGKTLLGEYKPDEVGIGVAQGTHPQLGENAIWIVVLLAEKR